MEIYFCEECTKRVVDVELERGEGRRVGDRVWCKRCVEYSPGYEDPSLPETRPGAMRSRTKTGHRLTAVGARSRAVGRKTSVGLALAFGLVVAVAAAVFLVGRQGNKGSRGKGQGGRPARPHQVHRSDRPVRPKAPFSPETRPAVRPSKVREAAGPSGGKLRAEQEKSLREAREALRGAVERAGELARKGDFDGAGAVLKSLPPGAARRVYEELAAAKARVRSDAESKVDGLLEDAERLLAGGETAEALAAVEALDGLQFAAVLPMAPSRVEEIREKVTEAEAEARTAAERRQADLLAESLGEFETLVAEGRYARARQEAERRAAESGSESISQTMRAASRVARALQERRRLVRLALSEKEGRTVSVGTKKGLRRGELAGVDDEGFALMSRIIMNGRETGRRAHRIAWRELTFEHERRLLGDLERGGPDERIAEALVAIASGDARAAEAALEGTGAHALAGRVRERVGALRTGDVEAVAAKAWERLVAEAGADEITASRARTLAEEIADFEARFGKTRFAAARALEMARLQARLAARAYARTARGLVALYTFEEGEGTVVHDTSGVEPRMDLRLEAPGAVKWLRKEVDGRNGIQIGSPTKIIDTGETSKLLARMRATNEIAIEAHFQPANSTQGGPARVVSFSRDAGFRNFTLGQHGPEVIFRLRTTATDRNGLPSLDTQDSVLTGEPIHVVATFSAGKSRLYLNGKPYREPLATGGDFSGWQRYRLVLGSEAPGDRTWLGRIFLVAIYERALEADEVRRNFATCR